MIPDLHPWASSLSEIYAQVWMRLLRGVRDRRAPARHPTLAKGCPGRQVLAAALLGVTMVGAVLAHLLILVPSAVLGLICAAVIYSHREQMNQALARTA